MRSCKKNLQRFVLIVKPNNGIYGFAGWDKNRVGNKFRVFENNGKFFSTWYAQFNGEVMFRFATVNTTWNTIPGGGSYRKYIIEVEIDGHIQLLYLCPRSRLKTMIESALRDLNDSNVHEYVFRAWRNEFGHKEHFLDVFYHDVNLPKVDWSRLDETRTKILDNSPGGVVVWDKGLEEPRKLKSGEAKLLKSDKVCTVVRFIKDKVIPRHRTKPEDDDYLDWFRMYAQMDLGDARTVMQLRGFFRLP